MWGTLEKVLVYCEKLDSFIKNLKIWMIGKYNHPFS